LLRQGYPEASIEVIGKGWLQDLLGGEDCCDRTHLLVPPWTAYSGKFREPIARFSAYWLQIRHLRQQEFDFLISARFDPRENCQLRLLRARQTFGFRKGGEASGLHTISVWTAYNTMPIIALI
jgi:ADP-heptose:LPS heptosyltransferase